MRRPKSSMRAIVLQDRDTALLRDLFESRMMTTAHVAALHFDGHREYGKKRIQKLKAAGLVGERRLRVNEPALLSIATAGLALLRDRGTLADYPTLSHTALQKRMRVSRTTIDHELAVMDIKAAFHSAARTRPTVTIAEFSTWPLLNEFTVHGTKVKPDGFIHISQSTTNDTRSEHAFFVEVDRSTETQDTLVSRALAYSEYYRSGGFALEHGCSRSAYKEFPFRVLMIFKSAERRNNIAERLLLLEPPILSLVYLSTFEEVAKDPFMGIWIVPADYRIASKGTPYEPRDRGYRYKRSVGRDRWVDRTLNKIGILPNTLSITHISRVRGLHRISG